MQSSLSSPVIFPDAFISGEDEDSDERSSEQACSDELERLTASFTLPGTDGVCRLVEQAAANVAQYVTGDRVVLSSFNLPTRCFFEQLPAVLQRSVGPTIVIAARVPLIKFHYHGIAVDVVFASTSMPAPPTPEQMLDDKFLLNVSLESRTSVNGVRTVLEIRRSIGTADDYTVFLCVLKAVKWWAMHRIVYGNVFTYPNGVSLAIMVARACQVRRHLHACHLLQFFFAFYARLLACHDKIDPIFITPSAQPRRVQILGMPPCWEADRMPCKEELLPVLNPAYPYVNACHTVGRCGLRHFYAELTRAHTLLQSGTLTTRAVSTLWEPYCIGNHYEYFIEIHVMCVATSRTRCKAASELWKGYIESRLRFFIYALECLVDVRPYPEPIVSSAEAARGAQGEVRREVLYYFGVRPYDRLSPGSYAYTELDFAAPFAELQYAMTEGSRAANAHGFIYDAQTMRPPWYTVRHVSDVLLSPRLRQPYGRG